MTQRWREGGWAGRNLPAACFALVHVFIVAVLFRTVYRMPFSGLGLYFDYASKLLDGRVPYRDFALEYPPFALVFFTLPRLAGASFVSYYVAYQAQIVVWDIVALFTLAAIARRIGENVWVVLAGYTLMFLAAGPVIIEQYDLFPAVITLLALLAYVSNKPTGVWIALSLGALTKLYPLLLMPVFAMPALERRDLPALRRAAITCALTVLVAMSPLLVVAPTAIVRFFAYHGNRGIQAESTYAAFLLAADKLHLTHVGLEFSYGSWNVSGGAPDILALGSAFFLVLAVGGAWRWIYRRRAWDTRTIGASCALVVAAVLVSSKVLSPQYIIWLAPLLALAGPARKTVWPLFVLIGAATYYIFPSNYDRLIFRDDGTVITVLLIRDLMLIALALLLAASVARGAERPPEQPSRRDAA